MDLSKTIEANIRIMRLIEGKYGEEIALINASTLEARYWRQLRDDSEKARRALSNGGIVSKSDADKQ